MAPAVHSELDRPLTPSVKYQSRAVYCRLRTQAKHTPGIHIVAVADLSPDRARASLARVGWQADRYAARSLDEAARAYAKKLGVGWYPIFTSLRWLDADSGEALRYRRYAVRAFWIGIVVALVLSNNPPWSWR